MCRPNNKRNIRTTVLGLCSIPGRTVNLKYGLTRAVRTLHYYFPIFKSIMKKKMQKQLMSANQHKSHINIENVNHGYLLQFHRNHITSITCISKGAFVHMIQIISLTRPPISIFDKSTSSSLPAISLLYSW